MIGLSMRYACGVHYGKGEEDTCRSSKKYEVNICKTNNRSFSSQRKRIFIYRISGINDNFIGIADTGTPVYTLQGKTMWNNRWNLKEKKYSIVCTSSNDYGRLGVMSNAAFDSIVSEFAVYSTNSTPQKSCNTEEIYWKNAYLWVPYKVPSRLLSARPVTCTSRVHPRKWKIGIPNIFKPAV